MDKVVDPRDEADGQIALAFEIMVEHSAIDDAEREPYSSADLEELFWRLSMAIVQLKKVPGGQEAHDRGILAIKAELHRRDELRGVAEAQVRAVYGDDVDLSPGTAGAAAVEMTLAEMRTIEKLKAEVGAAAAKLR